MAWPRDEKMTDGLLKSAEKYIRDRYEGVFSDAQMGNHFRSYVGLDLSKEQLSQIEEIVGPSRGKRWLDLGCGFGSFVLVSRRAGIEAAGIDIGQYEIDFARRRLREEMPELNPETVYLSGNARATELQSHSYDLATAWNLLEHIVDYKRVIGEAYRLLKPGGFFIGVAPNYFSFRREAHYQVPWIPLLPRPIARAYLRCLGRRTDFFQRDIHYVTNWGILRALKTQGFKLVYPGMARALRPDLIRSLARRRILGTLHRWHLDTFVEGTVLAVHWNPLKRSVYATARKPE